MLDVDRIRAISAQPTGSARADRFLLSAADFAQDRSATPEFVARTLRSRVEWLDRDYQLFQAAAARPEPMPERFAGLTASAYVLAISSLERMAEVAEGATDPTDIAA